MAVWSPANGLAAACIVCATTGAILELTLGVPDQVPAFGNGGDWTVDVRVDNEKSA